MIKKPLKTIPIYTIPDDYVSPVGESALSGSGKTRMLSAFLLNDFNQSLVLTGHMVARITKSKVGLRKIITVRQFTK